MVTPRLLFTIALFSVLLAACGTKTVLPPEEVIRRAIIRSNVVESVAVSLSADFHREDGETLSGSTIVQGVIRSGGQAWSADSVFALESRSKRGHERADGRIVIVFPGTGRMFLRLESAQGSFGDVLKKAFSGSTNGWMVYGDDVTLRQPARRTPDPATMSSYADALTVTEDLGQEKDSRGRLLYHYRVTLKPEVLSSLPDGGTQETVASLSANGEMWIDATDFSLSRVRWNLTGVPTPLGPLTIHADASFSDYDSAARIEAPTGSSSLLPLESIFAIFSS